MVRGQRSEDKEYFFMIKRLFAHEEIVELDSDENLVLEAFNRPRL